MLQLWLKPPFTFHSIQLPLPFQNGKCNSFSDVCALRRYLCFIAGLILPIVHRTAANTSAAAYSNTFGHATANLAFESVEDLTSTTLLLLLMPLVVPLTWIRSFSGLSNVSVYVEISILELLVRLLVAYFSLISRSIFFPFVVIPRLPVLFFFHMHT